MGDVYRVTVAVPEKKVSVYVLGEKEKDFFLRVFKEYAKAEKLQCVGNTEESD